MSISSRRLVRVSKKQQTANLLVGADAISRTWGWIATSNQPESNLTDDNSDTHWSARIAPEGSIPTVPVDIRFYLNGKYSFSHMVFTFPAGSVKTYRISVSDDNKIWTEITTNQTTQGQETIATINDFTAKPQGAYVQINVLDTWPNAQDVSIDDAAVYGTLVQAAPFGAIQHLEAIPALSSVHVAWDYLGTPLSSISILRDGIQIATLPAASRAYADKSAVSGTSYQYTVTGIHPNDTTVTASVDMAHRQGHTGMWLSGNSGAGYPDGSFSAWRGKASSITSNWANDDVNMVNFWNMDEGFESYDWSGSMDLCVGAFSEPGETWARAAAGDFDTLWTASLNKAKERWTRIPRGTLYIRLAHEMNGDWFPWQVRDNEIADFITAWRKFYTLKQSIFPEAKLVFNTNASTIGFSYDWRTLWPGDEYVDVYSTDWYAQAYKVAIVQNSPYDSHGGPIGLEQHRQFAEEHGKPFSIPEWGVNHDSIGTGDDANYIQYMHDFARSNGGTSAGNLLYEVYFNITKGFESADFQLYYPDTQSNGGNPLSSARYKSTFGTPSQPGISPVSNLVASPETQSMTLTWEASTSTIGGYHVYRNGMLLKSVNALTTVDSDLIPATSYTYAIRAFQGGVESPAVSVTATTATLDLANPAWNSGAEGDGIENASVNFAAWRGTWLTIATTDVSGTVDTQQYQWKFEPTYSFDTWTKDVDINVGAIFQESGETWAQAAAGAYDARWTTMFQHLKSGWELRSRGTLYVRFAARFNTQWHGVRWAVADSETADFIAAWRRAHALKQSIFPAAKLVFSTYPITSGPSYDWRTLWPGDAYVDVYATEYNSDTWTKRTDYGTGVDATGAPTWLTTHRDFATLHGKPFAVPDWYVDYAANGDQPDYITFMHSYFAANIATLAYETYNNVEWNSNIKLYPASNSPSAATRYTSLF